MILAWTVITVILLCGLGTFIVLAVGLGMGIWSGLKNKAHDDTSRQIDEFLEML